MNLERAAMKGRLAELERQANTLRTRGRALSGSIRTLCNEHLRAFEDMAIAEAAELMDQAVNTQAELLGTLSEIARLKRELD